jgi:hypothetical protein
MITCRSSYVLCEPFCQRSWEVNYLVSGPKRKEYPWLRRYNLMDKSMSFDKAADRSQTCVVVKDLTEGVCQDVEECRMSLTHRICVGRAYTPLRPR